MLINPNIKAICFDAFGTLVEITQKRRPFRHLPDILTPEQVVDIKNRIMREPISMWDLATQNPSPAQTQAKTQTKMQAKQTFEQELAIELASIRLRPHINDLWFYLKEQGYKIAICSNLAHPYGAPLIAALPQNPDALILSYQTGYIKPEPEIYKLVCDKLALSASNILFTGDTKSADVIGPREFGMEAELIDPFINRFLHAGTSADNR